MKAAALCFLVSPSLVTIAAIVIALCDRSISLGRASFQVEVSEWWLKYAAPFGVVLFPFFWNVGWRKLPTPLLQDCFTILSIIAFIAGGIGALIWIWVLAFPNHLPLFAP